MSTSTTLHSVTLPPSCNFKFGAWVFCASMVAAKKISVWAPDVILSVSLISREKTTAINSFQEYSLISWNLWLNQATSLFPYLRQLPADDRMGVEPEQLSDSPRLQVGVVVMRRVPVPLQVVVPGRDIAFSVRFAALHVILDEFDALLVETVRRIGMPAVGRLNDAVCVGDCGHERILAD